jgi:Spy/CpxP family protein refolding chaperone
MMLPTLRAATIGLLLAGAAPLFAQVAAPPAPPAPMHPPQSIGRMHGGGNHSGKHGGGMFAGLSEAGRTTMREAMRAGGDPRADRDAVKAARDRMLTVLDAESLDTGALKRAMDDERRAAQAGHDKRQAAMLAGFTKLSTGDRKAFVANARAMKQRMEVRVVRMKQRGVVQSDDMPAPPPPPMM